jgi:type IX secretion system PorP/SprF family membrane protein
MTHYLFFTCLLCSVFTFAQQDVHLSLYRHHINVFNSAYTGVSEYSSIKTSFRSQWSGIKNAPRVQAVSFSMPSADKRVGYGLLITNDKTFIERQTKFFANFSYRLPLPNKGNLYLGINAGGNSLSVDFNGLKNLASNKDNQFQSYSNFNPNVGVGAYLERETFFISLSIPELLSTKRNKDNVGLVTSARDRPHVYWIGGVKIPIQQDWTWVGSTFFRFVSDAPISTVMNTGVLYKTVKATIGYQFNAAVVGTLLFQTQGAFAFGYSYQAPTAGNISSLTGGNHELLLKIKLGANSTPTE